MYVGRWLTFAAEAVLNLAVGFGLTFSLYANTIRDQNDFSDTQLQCLGTGSLTAGLLTFVPALVFDQYLGRLRMAAVIGGVVSGIGYWMMWNLVTDRIPSSLLFLFILQLFIGLGQAFINTAALSSFLLHFETRKGAFTGTLQSFVGIGGSIAAAVDGSFPGLDGSRIFLFLAIASAVTAIIGAFFLYMLPDDWITDPRNLSKDEQPYERMLLICRGIVLIVALQIVSGVLTELQPRRSRRSIGFLAASLVILLVTLLYAGCAPGGPVSYPIREAPLMARSAHTKLPHPQPRESLSGAQTSDKSVLQAIANEVEAEHATEVDVNRFKDLVLRDLNARATLSCADFWLLFAATVTASASGLIMLTNIASIAFGSMLFGFSSDWLLISFKVPRTAFLPFIMIAQGGVFILAALWVGPKVLLAAVVLDGLCVGAFSVLTQPYLVELFGPKALVTKTGLTHVATTIGLLISNNGIVGPLSDRTAKAHGQHPGLCTGHDCFRSGFLAVGSLSIASSIVGIVLHFRNRSLYHRLAYLLKQREMHNTGLQPQFLL